MNLLKKKDIIIQASLPHTGSTILMNLLQGLIDKALLAIDVALMGLSILGILFPEP